MYNRYLNAEGFAEYFAPQAEAPAAPAQPERPPQPAQPAQPQPPQPDRQSQGRRPGLLACACPSWTPTRSFCWYWYTF